MVDKKIIHYSCEGRIEKSVTRDHRLSSLSKPRDAKRQSWGWFFLSYPHTHDCYLESLTFHLKIVSAIFCNNTFVCVFFFNSRFNRLSNSLSAPTQESSFCIPYNYLPVRPLDYGSKLHDLHIFGKFCSLNPLCWLVMDSKSLKLIKSWKK